MASLSPPFILCPLPDRQALLGIRPDRLPNKAIITLGRNIAIRYHVLEQKQESSWTTSRYWFTSPVTYCHDLGKYGAILNNNIIALWDEADSSLSNITKLKLTENVFGLHTSTSGRTIVVMNGGKVAYFSDVSTDKKIAKAAVLDPKETVVSFEIDEKNDQSYLITKKVGSTKLSVLLTGIEKESNNVASRTTFGSDSHEIRGHCLLVNNSDTCIVYFCSDGHIYKRNMKGSKSDCEPVKLANLTSYVNSRNPIVLRPLNDNSSCVAIYGCDPSEEGAIVFIYDIHYDVVVSKQPLKLYANPPLMDEIGTSLFVPLGLHILVLNYKTTKSLLSSVVGKHQAAFDAEVFEGRNPWISEGWNIEGSKSEVLTATDSDKDLENLKEAYPSIWDTIQQVKILESEGQPEAVISNHVIPSALENGNGAALDWILNTFLDIPEVHVVSMVVFSLQDVNISPDGTWSSVERLDKLLLRKFDKNLLTLSLRHVEYDDSKKLLQYINTLIKNQWQLDIETEEDSTMTSWLKWCSCIVDAHYTKFVLHSDTDIIDNLLESVSECTNVMKTVEEMEPFLVMTHSKTSFEPTADNTTRWRTETVTFV